MIKKLAMIRTNSTDPCPFGLEIPVACTQVGELIDQMQPLSEIEKSDQEHVAKINQHLFLWQHTKQSCRYAGKILEADKQAVECNWGTPTAGEEGTSLSGTPMYDRNAFGDGMMNGLGFPAGSMSDTVIDGGSYFGPFSIESVAAETNQAGNKKTLMQEK